MIRAQDFKSNHGLEFGRWTDINTFRATPSALTRAI